MASVDTPALKQKKLEWATRHLLSQISSLPWQSTFSTGGLAPNLHLQMLVNYS